MRLSSGWLEAARRSPRAATKTKLVLGSGIDSVAPNGAIWSSGGWVQFMGGDRPGSTRDGIWRGGRERDVKRPLLSVYGPMFDVAEARHDGRTPRAAAGRRPFSPPPPS